jgi:prepilin-type N-terminal cleavage/methylation domain-containing protein
MMNLNKIRTSKEGFTLVEIAIVMVIIGLLIGGVLKGQAMIQNAKVKRVAKQADEIRAAVMSFYDKYGMYPGDENIAAIPPGTDGEGNGGGQIQGAAEESEVFRDLQLAGLISGVYNGTTDFPRHAFGDTVRLYWVNPPGAGTAQHYLRFDNLPADVCLELDTKYDNSVWNTGSIVGNAAYTAGTTVGQLYILF